jgi:hypothetical protein
LSTKLPTSSDKTMSFELEEVPPIIMQLFSPIKARAPITSRAGIAAGTRNNSLTSIGGKLRFQGHSQAQIEALLQVKNREECHPPLPEAEVSAIARSLDRYAAGDSSKEDDRQKLILTSWETFKSMELPKPLYLLEPILPCPGLVLLHAPTGVGKTNVAIHIALAVASGHDLMEWTAGSNGVVAFIDGEMTASILRKRMLLASAGYPPLHAALHIATPDLNLADGLGMPDLGTSDGQDAVDSALPEDVRLIIVDNLSSLVRSGEENMAEYWSGLQAWALRHRAQGRTVLFVHHDGKSGNSFRGTSKIADVMDVVVQLKRPDDYKSEEGARVIVRTMKSRLQPGLADFEARLEVNDDSAAWVYKTPESKLATALDLSSTGMSQREIATRVGVSPATVNRWIKEDKLARDADKRFDI